MSSKSTDDIELVIANGRRLVAEAREAIAASERFFAEQNIDPKASLEFLRQHGGDPAVQAVQAEVDAIMLQVEQDMERRRLHEPTTRPAGKRARVRNMI